MSIPAGSLGQTYRLSSLQFAGPACVQKYTQYTQPDQLYQQPDTRLLACYLCPPE